VEPDPTKAFLGRVRTDAQEQVAALTVQLHGVMEASRDTNADDEHDPEGATIAFERAQLAALLTAARQRLADIDEALRLVDEGRYGQCEVCGQPIAAERLAVRPTARTCVGCAARRA
jgi:RNA polymerase-binding transcription factor DksA